MNNPDTIPEAKLSEGTPQSNRRRWMFRLIAVLVAFGALPCLEFLFRIVGIGPDLSLIVDVTPDVTTDPTYSHMVNAQIDLAYYGRTALTGPEERPLVSPKPPELLRVVVVGGSTVIGFPYAPALAFPRHIEHQLAAQSPKRRVEVINLGITAVNSFAVSDIVRQCPALEPDLIVIHTGHNEFYGPGGPASNAFNLSPAVIRQTYRLRRSRVIQWGESLFSGDGSESEDLLSVLPKQLEVPIDGDVYERAKENLEANLLSIVDFCTSEQIPVLLTTVECNLRDQSPLRAVLPSEVGREKHVWNRQMTEAASQILEEKFDDALTTLDDAGEICSEHADWHYRRGKCFHALGQANEAWTSFSRARDLDTCRFRMPGEFRDIVKRVTSTSDTAAFLDIAAAMADEGYDGPPGFDLFLEHVHYNSEGHWLLGKVIAKKIQTDILEGEWDSSQAIAVAQVPAILGLLPEDELAATSFAIKVHDTGPLSQSTDRKIHLKYLSRRTREIYTGLSPVRQEAFADLPVESMASDLMLALLAAHSTAPAFVKEIRNCIRIRTPWKKLSPRTTMAPIDDH